MNRYLEREVFGYCPETCPGVEQAFVDAWDKLHVLITPENEAIFNSAMDELCETIKDVGTFKLRDALREAVKDKDQIESELDEVRFDIRRLESEVEDLRTEIRRLESIIEAGECDV